MAFVNEYILPNDIARIDLYKKVLKKYPLLKEIPSTFNPAWTVDRERNIYLMTNGSWDQAHEDEPWYGFKLVLNDESEFDFFLNYGAGRSSNLTDNPFVIVWDFLKLEKCDKKNYPEDAVILLLKEALATHGYMGVAKKIPNTVVKFNF